MRPLRGMTEWGQKVLKRVEDEFWVFLLVLIILQRRVVW